MCPQCATFTAASISGRDAFRDVPGSVLWNMDAPFCGNTMDMELWLSPWKKKGLVSSWQIIQGCCGECFHRGCTEIRREAINSCSQTWPFQKVLPCFSLAPLLFSPSLENSPSYHLWQYFIHFLIPWSDTSQDNVFITLQSHFWNVAVNLIFVNSLYALLKYCKLVNVSK